uniref:Secreted protein n=1 Tax=Amphimedon queenslandica TaxID=400682 RepID=A0A1X7VIR1_AMPQE
MLVTLQDLIFCSLYRVWTCLPVATDNFKGFYCKPTPFDVPMKLNFAGILTPGVRWERQQSIKRAVRGAVLKFRSLFRELAV